MKHFSIPFFLLFTFSCGPSSIDVSVGKEPMTDSGVEAMEDDASNQADSEELNCETAPYVSWDNWVGGAFSAHCQGCHSSTAMDRYGAPETVFFDSESDALDWLHRIDIRVLQEETMPPAGGLLQEELTLIEIWLRCWN